MILKVIFAQRKCRYEGEYAPEALACITDAHDSDNPDYLETELAEARLDSSFASVKVIDLEVDDDAVEKILGDLHEPLKTEIKQ